MIDILLQNRDNNNSTREVFYLILPKYYFHQYNHQKLFAHLEH